MKRRRPPILPYYIPWEPLYDVLTTLYPLQHVACRWAFAMWARTVADEWPRGAPWWGGYKFDEDAPRWLWPKS